MEHIKKFIVTSIIFIIIDSFYLNSTSLHFNKIIQNIQGSPLKLNFFSLILTYIALVLGLYYFIIKENKSILDAALFGLAVYSVYDFTNKAIFNNWTWNTVIMDSLWGSLLYGLTTYFVYKIYGIK